MKKSVLSVFHKLGLYYRAIKHLRPIQIRYRLWYILRDKFRKLTGHSYPRSIPKERNIFELVQGIQPPTSSFQPPKTFTFLNQSQNFDGKIDWNFDCYGKLWAYNLNYFDYLQQKSMTKEQGLERIREFIYRSEENREGMEPYPISLRGINWIKFLAKYEIQDSEIDASLYAQYQILLDNLEYHILGNHLLENGVSLLFGAYYFRDQEMLKQSKQLLVNQLEEQILGDGGHFERSPMYHQIILGRLLDCINLLSSNTNWCNKKALLKHIRNKAEIMLGWLQRIRFTNGDIPHVNDSTNNIAVNSEQLADYAKRLGVDAESVELGQSGYRKLEKGDVELFIDIGKIGPDYQPAHAHSDTFSFLLHFKNKPVIVEQGTSTYEQGARRKLERSTSAHNTVRYGDTEQSEMWDVFRVARRAYPTDVKEGRCRLKASHNGYRHLNVTHQREWFMEDDKVIIIDQMKGDIREESYAFFHFHKSLKPIKINNGAYNIGPAEIGFKNLERSEISPYQYATGFNRYQKAYRIKVTFKHELETKIKFNM